MSKKRFSQHIANLCPVPARTALIALAAFIALAALASLLLLLSPAPATAVAAPVEKLQAAAGSPAPVVIAATMAASGTTTTILQHTPDPSLVGEPIWVEFQVVPSPYNGESVDGTITVTVSDDAASCSRTVDSLTSGWPYPNGWRWDCDLTPTSDGAKTLTATFTPIYSDVFASSSDGEGHVVNEADTTITLNSAPNPSAFGETVVFTATVNPPGSGTPTGTVTFKDGAAAIGAGTLNASGVATFSTSTLDVGIHTVTAEYGGDSNFNGSTSDPLTHTVTKASIITTLESAPNPSVFGETVVFTATVSSGGGTPTGIVFFNLDDDTTLGVAALDATGVATFTTAVLAAGLHNVTAVYHGDENYEASESAPLTHTVDSLPDPDLSIAKTDHPDPVYAGQELFYEVIVTNHSEYTTATSVVVSDTLSAEVTYIADTAGCTRTPGPPDVLVCSLDDIAPGASRSFQIKTRVAPDAVASEADGTIVVSNHVTVTLYEEDTVPANNTVTEGTFVEESADLKITKYGKPDGDVQAGQTLTYTLFIDNLGPSYARTVVVTDTMLSDGTFQLLSVTSDQGEGVTCDPTSGVFNEQADITCQLNGNLEPASPTATGRWTITMTVTADETVDVNNTARVTSDTPDPVTTNNQADTVHSFTDTADLELSKSAVGQFMDSDGVISQESNKVTAGLVLTYSLTVTNTGPSTAENVIIEDDLPAEVEVISVEGQAASSCNAGVPGDPFRPTTCNFDTLALDATRAMTIVVRVKRDEVTNLVDNEAIIHNDARTFSDIFDPDNSDNLAMNATTVDGRYTDLKITKFGKPDGQVRAGEFLTYTVIIDNLGPGYAHSVVLTDVIQSSGVFTLTQVTSDRDALCTPDPTTLPKSYNQQLQLRCALTGTLEVMTPSTSGRWIITMTVTADETQDINNVAHVVSDDFDPVPSNN